MEFFIDRNVPERLARLLDVFDRENSIVYHDDWFEPATADAEWLSALGSRDPRPSVVTGDGRILRNPAEGEALRRVGLTFFVFSRGWSGLRWEDRAWKTIKVWPLVVEAAEKARVSSIFEIPIGATKVERVSATSDVGRKGRR